ncbi:tRNA (N(6)-L-threonylcarbamoyladenosine(37)-C(2))-methylthiotransferase MtaB [Chloroflexota bacterium]
MKALAGRTEQGDRPRVSLQTLGCKLNQAETESLARRLDALGFQVVAPGKDADVYLLNTCTVTHAADRKCRHLIRLARRSNAHALIAVTGCYAERAPLELSKVGGIDLISGNGDKGFLPEKLSALFGSPKPGGENSELRLRTRAQVKVQEGCSQTCTFCIVPGTRGRGRSVPPRQVVAQVRERAAEGHQEVVLTGTQIGDYRGEGESGLHELVERILAETDIPRIRLSSLQPMHINRDFLLLWRDARICRHLHLPLQSGSDSVLGRMGRLYSTSEYETAVDLAREMIPDLGLTTDIIVGFPGEDEGEYEKGFRFCERIGFSRIHVFPYSDRPGTSAALMRNKVGESVKKERLRAMLALAGESSRRFRQKFIGKTLSVLIEGVGSRDDECLWVGYSDNYLKVFINSGESLANKLVWAQIAAEYDKGLHGQITLGPETGEFQAAHHAGG